jgi:uncharacterized membrane protein YraQ (UPF0718 family)
MKASPGERGKGAMAWVWPWLFLFAVGAVYAAAYGVDAETTASALASLQVLLLHISPILVLVFFFLFLANAFLSRKWISRHLGAAAGFKGWALTITAGVFSAGPLYAWYPLLADLKAKGMHSALIAAFLYARALKLPLLPMMVHYFGFAYTATVSVCIVVFSVLSGLLIGRLSVPKDVRVRSSANP